jgi:thymidylate synthase (FAD)
MNFTRILSDTPSYLRYVEHWGLGDAGVDEAAIIEAARMSTNKGFNGWPEDEKLLAHLYNNKHMTPFEMAGMTIEIAAPIFVFREWHRHRTQSYNEMSGRYIPLPADDYLPTIERVVQGARLATANKQTQGTTDFPVTEDSVAQDREVLEAVYTHMQEVYEYLLGRGWPKELARCSTGVARYSRMRASGNLRNWLAFLTLRQDPKAQWEIRQYANAVGKVIATNFPRTWKLYCA